MNSFTLNLDYIYYSNSYFDCYCSLKGLGGSIMIQGYLSVKSKLGR